MRVAQERLNTAGTAGTAGNDALESGNAGDGILAQLQSGSLNTHSSLKAESGANFQSLELISGSPARFQR